MAHLLVVEDEPHIASGLRFNLEAEQHDVTVVDSGEAALAAVDARPDGIDCVILDVMLPGLDGFAVASRLRARGWFTPILMLTARGRAEDVLRGFESGADDYLPKPFDLSILVARVGALLRRHAWHRSAGATDAPGAPGPRRVGDRFSFAGRTVDFEAQEVRVGDQVHPLTLMEANLLRYLVAHDGQAVPRGRMLADVWNLREDTDTRAIDHFIARLRKYVEDEPARPRFVQTVRGVGYRFVSAPDAGPRGDREDG
ncbi:MAG: response regulator transcription factor [Vicinamibacterales bacterium]